MSIKNLFLMLCSLSPIRYKAIKCGHRTKRSGYIHSFGQKSLVIMSKSETGSLDYCLNCIGKMTIKCAWCSNLIFVGDPITLYTPRSNFELPEHAVIYNNDPLQLIGCLGWDCAEIGGDRAGFWLPGENGKGYVYRVPTISELIRATGGESIIIVGNLGDIGEAINPTIIPDEDH